MLLDLHNNIKCSTAFAPAAAVTDNTAQVSTIVDTAGYGSCELIGVIPLDKWDRCKAQRVGKETDRQLAIRFAESLRGKRCYAAIDMANTGDLAALALVFPTTIDGAKYYSAIWQFWCAEVATNSAGETLREILRPWINAGYINQSAGDQIDQREIKQALINASKCYDIIDCAFDPWNARQTAGELIEHGFKMVEFTQSINNYNEGSKEFESAIRGRRLTHDGSPVMRWMIGNCVFRTNGIGYMMPDRKKSRSKIDGVAAGIMGIARAMQGKETSGGVEIA